MCKNSRRYNRTRNFGLYGHAESKKNATEAVIVERQLLNAPRARYFD